MYNLFLYCHHVRCTIAMASTSYSRFESARAATPNKVLGGRWSPMNLTYASALDVSLGSRSTTKCVTLMMSAGVAPTAARHFPKLARATCTCSEKVGGTVLVSGSRPICPAMVTKVLVEDMGVVWIWEYVGLGAATEGGLISREDIVTIVRVLSIIKTKKIRLYLSLALM